MSQTESDQRLTARELHELDNATRRVLDSEPVCTDAWESLEGELVLRTGGSPPAPAVREDGGTPRTLLPDDVVQLQEHASDGAQETWREVWEGQR